MSKEDEGKSKRSADQVWNALAPALNETDQTISRLQSELAATRAELSQLVDIFVGQGTLTPNHRKLLSRVARSAGEPPRVHLQVVADKYVMEGSDVDCDSLLPICRARCCSLHFPLSRQDLDEGKVRWQIDNPYMIRQNSDGYCTHIDRASKHCTVYEVRPAACRGFDCREDPRIWTDFEKRILAPWPAWVKPD